MAETCRFAVMLIVESADPRLSADTIEEAVKTAGGVAKLRRALLERLPQDTRRVVAVFPVEHAKLLLQLHEAVGEEIAAELGAEGAVPFVRPPPDYVPPSRE